MYFNLPILSFILANNVSDKLTGFYVALKLK